MFPDSFHFFALTKTKKMKQLIGILLFTLFVGTTFAQDIQQKNVPAVVLNAFQIKFPNASDVDWRLEKGNYRIKFEVNNKDNKLVLDDRGKLMKHEQDLWESEIPVSVLETVKSKVAFFDLNDADKLVEGSKTIYSINFEIDKRDHDFLLDGKGKLLSYEKELKDSEVPISITNIIKNKYGELDIDDADYKEKNGKINYQLKGEINDKDHSFLFDEKGTVLKHQQDLRNDEIPAAIRTTLKTSFNGFEIRDADLLEERSSAFYELSLRKSKEKIHVIFNPLGKVQEVKKD